MKINIFLSYSLGDLDVFKIEKIADLLRSKPEIGEVVYWRKNTTGNISLFMEESLKKCHILLLFCSKRSEESEVRKKEVNSAAYNDKVIIPVYHKLEHIPSLIRARRGVEFDFLEFDKTFDLIYTLVQHYVPKLIETSMDKINLFLSYALGDIEDLKIEKIADHLSGKPEIGEVMYWRKNATGNISLFMEESLKKCHILLLFCSKRTEDSKGQRKVWSAASLLNKVIIPVYHKVEHVPLLIRRNRGVEFDFYDFKVTLNQIDELLQENIQEFLKIRKDYKPIFAKTESTLVNDNFRDLKDLVILENAHAEPLQNVSELEVERKKIDTSSQNGELTIDSEIEPPFDAYEGNEPYLFVSYAHLDKELVYPIIDELDKQGVRIWYDEGIPAASDWIAEIADTIINSACFLVFLTPRALQSEHVRDEIHLAKDEQKKMFVIYLEDTDLPPDIRLQIGRKQALFRHRMSEERFWKKLRNQLFEVISKPPLDNS